MSDRTEAAPTCRVVKTTRPFVGKQQLTYAPAISAETVGSSHIHMQLVTIPPRAKAVAHRHDGHETALYVLSGTSGMWYGEGLTEHCDCEAGDFLYIPAGVPHLPYNPSLTEPCTAVIARTDPNEQESVVLMPELDGIRQTT
ncbi:cupin domain-containing protein [uncultured Alsobacter sp.]|uniref:cupin domain-containing protein n=1 Tax=uncultured Alsobacter sp. TaxID=1748258 RepID=UPI0025E74AC0|nr:cupin domain-containing protein [uncultured Alsobacter sp.]